MSKASKHEPKASAFCEPKTSTATTGRQKAHLALGAHYIFCNTSIVFRVFFIKNEAYGQTFFARCCTGAGKKKLFLPAAHRSGQKRVFLTRRSINDHFQLA